MASSRLLQDLDHLGYVFRVIGRHPLTRNRKLVALKRWLRWQVGSRLVPGAVVVPYVNQTKLLVGAGMHGATLNIYVGLADFAEMAFMLHFLRPADLFVDVGANVGVYTVLASGAIGCRSIAFEPSLKAYENLQANVDLNGIRDLVTCYRVAVGHEKGKAMLTTELKALNHIVLPFHESDHKLTEVEMTTLDAELSEKEPTLLKVDVEGFESLVISGAVRTLGKPSLQAMIIELGGSGERYGAPRDQTFERVTDFGFTACLYDPVKRQLLEIAREEWRKSESANSIFIRDFQAGGERVQTASTFMILEREI